MKRYQSRRANGRFQKNTLANTFGLNVETCTNPDCRAITPWPVHKEKPTACQRCGATLKGGAVANDSTDQN